METEKGWRDASSEGDGNANASDIGIVPLDALRFGARLVDSKRVETALARHRRELYRQNATIVDALSGEKLDVLKQCVRVRFAEGSGGGSADDGVDEDAIWKGLLQTAAGNRGGYIVEGPPASGKTVLTKRLIVESVKRGSTPVLIPLVRLAAVAEKARSNANPGTAFEEYLRTLEPGLAQAVFCRRCTIIFDGLDEAGAYKQEQTAMMAKLVQEGFPIIVTTRPEGYDPTWALAGSFRILSLQHLNLEQQQFLAEKRLGLERAQAFVKFAEPFNVPSLEYSKELQREISKPGIASNPLMLSMLFCVFEQGVGDGREFTIGDLYAKALDIMLTRVEVKVQSDRTRVGDGVEAKFAVLQTIAFRCHTWRNQNQQMVGKRDFTAAEARGWVGSTKEDIWANIQREAEAGRYPSLAMFVEKGTTKLLFYLRSIARK